MLSALGKLSALGRYNQAIYAPFCPLQYTYYSINKSASSKHLCIIFIINDTNFWLFEIRLDFKISTLQIKIQILPLLQKNSTLNSRIAVILYCHPSTLLSFSPTK